MVRSFANMQTICELAQKVPPMEMESWLPIETPHLPLDHHQLIHQQPKLTKVFIDQAINVSRLIDMV